jgi:hypothetical protein
MTCQDKATNNFVSLSSVGVSFSARRAAICQSLDCSNGDTCLVTEAKHPGKSSIASGTKRPELRCPKKKPEWLEEPSECKECGRQKQILSSLQMCRFCQNDYDLKKRNQARSQVVSHKPHRSTTTYKPSRIDWFVAVTTAPRKDCTLIECVGSIRQAGWEPTIFAEPGSTKTNCVTVINESRKGVWHNWLNAARYALESTSANTIMTVQDDSLFHPDSKAFAESILWPAKGVGYVSLYTPSHYSARYGNAPGVIRVRTSSMWGACALVFSRKSLTSIVNHSVAKSWLGVAPRTNRAVVMKRRQDNPHTIANSDTAIGAIINSLGLTTYYVSPSPVRHIAEHSTIAHGGNKGRRNCRPCADHLIPLAQQVR